MQPPLPSELHLWYAELDEKYGTSPWNGWIGLLSAAETARMHAFRLDDQRRAFVMTRAFCRIVLSHYMPPPQDPRSLQFQSNKFGRPYVILPESAPCIDFNISHSKRYVVMAVGLASHCVGVDIEEVMADPTHISIVTQFFSVSEQAQFHQLSSTQQTDRFFELWTAKEAYIKARGMGISIPLPTFSVSICRSDDAENPLQVRLSSTPSNDAPDRWKFMVSDILLGHKLAVCSQINSGQEVTVLKYLNFHFDQYMS